MTHLQEFQQLKQLMPTIEYVGYFESDGLPLFVIPEIPFYISRRKLLMSMFDRTKFADKVSMNKSARDYLIDNGYSTYWPTGSLISDNDFGTIIRGELQLEDFSLLNDIVI